MTTPTTSRTLNGAGTQPGAAKARDRQQVTSRPVTAGAATGNPSGPAAGLSPPPKLRRRPALIALAVALIALGGATAAWLTTTVGNTRGVLAVRVDVPRGQTLTAQDLVAASINTDPALQTVPAGDLDSLVGQRAAVDLPAGTLLSPASVTDAVIPAAGQAVVGVSLDPSQLPARQLPAGAQVHIVDTPRAQEDPPARPPASTEATVVTQHAAGDDGRVVVDVTVPLDQADQLAARVATGRVAVVLTGADR